MERKLEVIKPEIKSAESSEKPWEVMTYDEFIERDPKPAYSNFIWYFTESYPTKRQEPVFVRFMSEHADLAKDLTKKMDELLTKRGVSRNDLLKEIEPELYEAYKIMINYPESGGVLWPPVGKRAA